MRSSEEDGGEEVICWAYDLLLQENKACKFKGDLRRTGKVDKHSSSSQWRVRKNGLLESVLVIFSGESGGATIQTTKSGNSTAGLQSDDLVPSTTSDKGVN
jgi:hypothetical protein